MVNWPANKLAHVGRMLRRQLRFSRQTEGAKLYECYVENAIAEFGQQRPPAQPKPSRTDVRLIAYYLPQFHPVPENDEWWGRGFTEWRNVTRAFPIFEGHYQPRSPGELGYYDLRVPEVMERQVALAQTFGIGAFCFHFYWFQGRRLLERPLQHYLDDAELDLPFCLCWANESWSRRWNGREKDVLLAQRHSAADDIAFIRYLDRYFRDPRYLRIGDKPVLTVYRPDLFPNMKDTIARWRTEIQNIGYEGIYLIATNAFDFEDHETCGFDALSEFPPHGVNVQAERAVGRTAARVREYAEASRTKFKAMSGVLHPGVMPSWDNSPRRPKGAMIYHGSTPELFQDWLSRAIRRAALNPRGERLVFINAWNEWGEGAYLEPDRKFGYRYLEACAEALANPEAEEMYQGAQT